MRPIYCTGGGKTPSNVVFKRISLASCAVLLSLSSVAYANPETEKGYILTPVEEQGKNTITKYEFNEETNKLEPVYYQVDLAKTEYGEGDTNKYFEWSEDEYNNYLFGEVDAPTNGVTTITAHYDTNKTSTRIDNTLVDYGDINNDFIEQSTSDNGGAIKNESLSQNAEIGDIKGNFIVNKANNGGAIYNNSESWQGNFNSTIGNITGSFVANKAINS